MFSYRFPSIHRNTFVVILPEVRQSKPFFWLRHRSLFEGGLSLLSNLGYCQPSLLGLGLKIKKVHRVLKFDQSPWLKQYIDFNTEKRKHAKNSFEKDFFKLMNNSVFGKTMENLRKQVDVRLVTNEKKLDKLTSKPTCISSKIFNENLMAVHKVKETLTLNRLAYVGMCILDLSKTLMYDFHYNYIKKKYNNRARLLFTDTDSLTYEIEAEDVYKDFWNDKDMFDNSDHPESSPYYCCANKKNHWKIQGRSLWHPDH